MKKFDEKKIILEEYNKMIKTFDKMQYISTYLKKIIDEVETDKDLLELQLDIPIISNQFSINGDIIFRYEKAVNDLYNKLELDIIENK